MHRQRLQDLCLPECIACQDAATLPAHNFDFMGTPSMIIEDCVHRIDRYGHSSTPYSRHMLCVLYTHSSAQLAEKSKHDYADTIVEVIAVGSGVHAYVPRAGSLSRLLVPHKSDLVSMRDTSLELKSHSLEHYTHHQHHHYLSHKDDDSLTKRVDHKSKHRDH